MKVIRKKGTEIKEVDYPCDISKPCPDLNMTKINGVKVLIDKASSEWIDFYFIKESKPENNNPDFMDLIQAPDVLTEQTHDVYKHLKICNRTWELVPKPEFEVINRINFEFENHIETNYPRAEREKHLRQQVFDKVDNDTKKYIKDLDTWIDECDTERANKEAAYLSGGFPDFKFKDKPIKK